MEFDWASLEEVRLIEENEEREFLTPLIVSRQNPLEDGHIQRSKTKIHIFPGAYLELRVNEGLPGKVYLDKMWLLSDVVVEPQAFMQ